MIKYNITPLLYSVNKYGTEQILPENTDSINTCAPVMNIVYGDNSPVLQDFMYRKSGGTEDIETGTAKIENIKGNTIAWNQIINGNNIVSGTCSTTLSYTSMRTSGFTMPSSHKMYVALDVDCSQVQNFKQISYNVSDSEHRNYITGGVNIQKGRISLIITPSYDNSEIRFFCSKTVVDGNADPYSSQNINIIDLTLIYGAGNEPTSVAQFEADYQRWFGKPLDYEPYDEGSLRNVMMSAVKTTGFNQWDEEWESGYINLQTGDLTPSTNQIRSKNFIPIVGGQYYCASSPNQLNFGIYVVYYDANKNAITPASVNNYKNNAYQSPLNARFAKFYCSAGYGSTYNHDICINISDEERNGTYEPYKENIASLPITTLTGKLNGQGESVTIFPDGMNRAGSAFDEIKVENSITKAIKRVGAVDLGSLNWNNDTTTYNGVTYHAKYANYPSAKAVAVDKKGNIICAKYTTQSATNVDNPNGIYDKVCGIDRKFKLWIYDSIYNDSSLNDFTEAMNGVMLYYELETPEVYELDITPQDLQKRYIGNDPVVRVYKGDTLLWEANNL